MGILNLIENASSPYNNTLEDISTEIFFSRLHMDSSLTCLSIDLNANCRTLTVNSSPALPSPAPCRRLDRKMTTPMTTNRMEKSLTRSSSSSSGRAYACDTTRKQLVLLKNIKLVLCQENTSCYSKTLWCYNTKTLEL